MTEKITIATEEGHWYDKQGNPRYEQPNKSKPGEMRSTTKRDAKKLDLIIGTTTIIYQLKNFFLEQWKQEQILLSAYTCPLSRKDVTAEEWLKRVLDDSQEQAKTARETGTRGHGVMEKGFQGQEITDEYLPRYLKVLDILKSYGTTTLDISPEKSFATQTSKGHWYGGKIDILSPNVLADLKFKEFILDAKNKPSKKLNYESDILQGAAYSWGVGHTGKIINIYVSTISDDVYCHEWSTTDYEIAIKRFELLTELWWLNW